jgi:crotonobetainyl-CoA:carnitine CoA-transferase CaiB-like acyl-CoA transferase
MTVHGPLEGIRVLDFTRIWAGPAMTAMLGDLGAEVIKVESSIRPDGTRLGRPIIYQDIAAGDEGLLPELQPLNHGLNRNKLSVTVNMGTQEGSQLLLRLAALCDVVCDNFRVGVMQRHGLGYDDIKRLKSDIIVLSLSGCGQWGPWADVVTFAPT